MTNKFRYEFPACPRCAISSDVAKILEDDIVWFYCCNCRHSFKYSKDKGYEMNSEIDRLVKQIETMKQYLLMNIERADWHSCWDGAIDIQRLQDKLDRLKGK